MTEAQTDGQAAQVARETMSDWLGVPVEECSENSRGALLIREGIRRYEAALPPPTPSVVQELVEAAQEVIDRAFMTYRRNGRDCYIEDDSGERCMIVPHDVWHNLSALLTRVKGSADV